MSISAPKIHTDLLWDLTFLFIGLAVVYFFFVFFYRNRLKARAERERKRKKELSPMISEFLFHEDEASKDEKSNYVNLKIEIRQLLKDDFNRKVLSEVLLDLRKDVAGDTQKRLFKLYQDLGLHNDAFEKLKSWRWELVSKAILDLTQMQVDEAYSFITKFINDKRATIRKQAEIAVVTLRPEGINYFLDTTKYRISEWQQLKLLDVLRVRETYQPPRFKAWLTSTNRYVVLFTLRLIKFYNQNDANAALIELVKHKNDQIKEEAIACIKEFHVVEAIEMLKLVFWKSSTDVKISILGAIGELGNQADIEFLQLIEKKESNFSVKSKAFSSINAISPDSIMPTKGLLNTDNYEIPADILVQNEVNDNVPQDTIGSVIEEEPKEINLKENDMNGAERVLKNLDVYYEEVTSGAFIESMASFENRLDDPKGSSGEQMKEDDGLSIDFLPFVVDEISETDIKNPQPKSVVLDVNQLDVDCEEVPPSEKKEYRNWIKHLPSMEITEEEIAFLPVVTENEEFASAENDADVTAILDIEVVCETITVELESLQNTQTSSHRIAIDDSGKALDYSKYQNAKILDAEVVYEEITTSTNKTFNSTSNTKSDPYRFPFPMDIPQEDTMDTTSIEAPQYQQSNETMDPQDEQKFKKIIKNLIDLSDDEQRDELIEKFQEWPLLEFGNEFIDVNSISEETEEPIEEKEKGELEDNPVPEVEENPTAIELRVPRAILTEDILDEIVLFKENTEESRMQLLDDLAEMGDYREIPLLKELLVNEKYRTVKDRVQKLIETFSEDVEKPSAETLFKPFNVFEDLFRTCDTEAKLILMDEIVAVGDEGEIAFLEELIEKEEEVVKQKAVYILEELRAKLKQSKVREGKVKADDTSVTNMEVHIEENTIEEYDSLMKELDIKAPKEDDLFSLEFELTEPLVKNETQNSEKDKSQNQTSIIGQICLFSHKILDRFNG